MPGICMVLSAELMELIGLLKDALTFTAEIHLLLNVLLHLHLQF